MPSSSARIRASWRTGPSEVPAETIVTHPRTSGTPRATQTARARSSSSASGATSRTAARAASSARVTRTLPAPRVEQRRDDRRHLLGRLALRQHRLGSALADLAVRVHAGEAEVAVRQLGEAVESVLRRDAPAPDLLQELGEVGAEVGHAPIIATG